jgi:hypothetical protein
MSIEHGIGYVGPNACRTRLGRARSRLAKFLPFGEMFDISAAPDRIGEVMPIEVKCPKCGRGHQARDELAGKRVKCSCGEALQVPATRSPCANPASLLDDLLPSAPPPAAAVALTRQPLRSIGTRKPTKANKSSLSTGAIIGIAGSAAAAIALIVGLVVWASGSLGTSTPDTAASGPSTAAPAGVEVTANSPAPVAGSAPAVAITALAKYADQIDEFLVTSKGNRLITTHADPGQGIRDCTFKLWDLGTGNELASFVATGYGGQLAATADGDLVTASGASQDTSKSHIGLFEFSTGKARFDLQIPHYVENGFSDDGTRLFFFDAYNFVAIDVNTGEQQQLEPPPRGQANYPYSLAYSPHGAMVADSWNEKKLEFADTKPDTVGRFRDVAHVEVFRAGTKEALLSTEAPSIVAVLAFSPDGGTLAAAFPDGQVVTWDTKSWKPSDSLTRPSTAGQIRSVDKMAISSGGQWVALKVMPSLGNRQLFEIWDLRSKQFHKLVGYAKDIAFTSDGSLIQTRISTAIGNNPEKDLFRFMNPATGDPLPIPPTKGK